MALKVNFEIGHVASIRTKKTPEGFTHDWEVYVRGSDNTEISHYVDKVIFILHDTFIKPKRVIKEPPYTVKESGYAGFNFPIEIHLKNREEPKIINYNYDLQLQPSGPPINKLRKEKYVFSNPTDDFKKKLLKGGATSISNVNPYFISNVEQERNSRDSFPDDKPAQLIGKPKLGGDKKAHKQKDYRMEDPPRASNSYVKIFGSPIHLSSRISPDPKKPSPNSKIEKKDKDKPYSDRDKQKLKHDLKEYKDEKKAAKDEKEKSKLDKKSKPHKVRDIKEKKNKRPAEKLPSPSPPAKRPAALTVQSPRRVPSPNNKSNSSASSKEEVKPIKHPTSVDVKTSAFKISDPNQMKTDKKLKKDKKNHDKEREIKKDQKEREIKMNIQENKDIPKPKEPPKESIVRNLNPVKEKDKPVAKPLNKFSIENMLKDPADANKYNNPTKHKVKTERERKHKHKKKDKKRDESRDKSKEPGPKEKKHKHDKHKEKAPDTKETLPIPEKIETAPPPREIDKAKTFKERDRSQLTISPISLDTSSQSSSKSGTKTSSGSKNPLSSMIDALPDISDSDHSSVSEDEDTSFNINNNRNVKVPTKPAAIDQPRIEPKLVIEPAKIEKPPEKISPGPSHRIPKKEKTSKEGKDEKKQRKRKSNSKDEADNTVKVPKPAEDVDQAGKAKRPDLPANLPETSQKPKSESSRSKSDTKVQDDGVSSSLSDNPKCDSFITEEEVQGAGANEISSDYMLQLRELQHKIMTIQSNEELERVVNLIAETGKYEVTKKTFDFDLCLLDRTTVQQLQEMIGCESRA